MEIQVKTEPKESEDLNLSDCILAKIKKEIEEDFAINEALLFDDETSREEEEEDNVVVKQEVGQDCYRVLVSIISWPGQLLSLNPCRRPKILARMLFWGFCL